MINAINVIQENKMSIFIVKFQINVNLEIKIISSFVKNATKIGQDQKFNIFIAINVICVLLDNIKIPNIVMIAIFAVN